MKKLIPIFFGTINDLGELKLNDIVKYKQYLMSLKGEVEITVRKKSNRKSRSNNQNSYYFGVVIPLIADYMGDTGEAAHEAMKMLFLTKSIKGIATTKSTAKLEVGDFEEYLSKIRMYMAKEHDVFVPKPNEVVY